MEQYYFINVPQTLSNSLNSSIVQHSMWLLGNIGTADACSPRRGFTEPTPAKNVIIEGVFSGDRNESQKYFRGAHNILHEWRSLSIRPQLGEDDIGVKQTSLAMSHNEAIEYVREVFTDVGFGISTEFSPSELLNEKVDRGHQQDCESCGRAVEPESSTQ